MIYQACQLENFDAETGVCSSLVWVETSPGILPPLGIGEGFTIGSAIVAVWTLGFSFKILRKFLFR